MKCMLIAIPTKIIKPHDDIISLLFDSLKYQKISLETNDILIISSKIIATSENRLKKLDELNPSEEAFKYAKETGLSPNFVEIVIKEAEKIYGWVPGALLTLRNGIMQANAGVDASNAPPGYAVLLPENPNATADNLRKQIISKAGKKIGIIISDSHTRPLRMGTTNFALAASGIEDVVIDERGKLDIYGRKMQMTRRAIADMVATAAQILTGETSEQIPIVILRGANIRLSEKTADECETDMKIDIGQDMFLGSLNTEL